MAKDFREKGGIKKLLKYYRNLFRTPENLNHYSPEDFKTAEKKYLRCAVRGDMIHIQKEVYK